MPEKDASETHLKRAILAVQSGRLEEARRLLVSILRQDPENAAAWVWLGKAVDDPEKRRECFSRALRADPNNEEARLGLVALLSGPQAEEASTGKPPMRIFAYPLRCPNCASSLRYDVSLGTLRCPNCGSQQEIPQRPDTELWLSMPPDMSGVEVQAEPIGRKTLRCRSCGAVSELSARTSSLTCPFCGSPQVLQEQGASYLIPPRAIVPFRVDRDQALQAVREWLGSGFWHPTDLARKAEVVDIQGVYLPFWVFKGLAEASYGPQASGLDDGPAVPPKITQHIVVPDALIPASFSLGRDMVRAIEPFDIEDTVPFRPEYLAGWPAEVYQVALADAAIQAREQMSRAARNKVSQSLVPAEPYVSVEREPVGWGSSRRQRHTALYRLDFCTVHLDSFLHLMLPVWIGAYRYRGRIYSFAVNGQTGKAGGEAPRSGWATALVVACGVVGLVALAGVLIFFGPAIWATLGGLLRGQGEEGLLNTPGVLAGVLLLLFLALALVSLWSGIRAWLQGRQR